MEDTVYRGKFTYVEHGMPEQMFQECVAYDLPPTMPSLLQ